jgi:transaldolase
MNDKAIAERIRNFVLQGITLGAPGAFAPNPIWRPLREAGSELWLDTGDISAASALWCADFRGLTTNNTLLNKEVQKGTYDALITQASELLRELPESQRVLEIAFVLNARHGLLLAQRFGAKVSVELHTDLDNDLERSLAYGLRFHQICPDHFIIKLPWTAAGLIATRRLRELGVQINLTLGFSARHNYIAARAFHPHYVNVFLGRLNGYISDNKLGDGRMVGEKATLASFQATHAAARGDGTPRSLQIAASLRDAEQVRSLAGVDVFTMPTAVAEGVVKSANAAFPKRVDDVLSVRIDAPERSVRAGALWDISDAERAFADQLRNSPPKNPGDLLGAAERAGVSDLFPRLSDEEIARIGQEGKIPKHASWATHIESGRLAIDSLLNAAGLRSFAKDQADLDTRIRSVLARSSAPAAAP